MCIFNCRFTVLQINWKFNSFPDISLVSFLMGKINEILVKIHHVGIRRNYITVRIAQVPERQRAFTLCSIVWLVPYFAC